MKKKIFIFLTILIITGIFIFSINKIYNTKNSPIEQCITNETIDDIIIQEEKITNEVDDNSYESIVITNDDTKIISEAKDQDIKENNYNVIETKNTDSFTSKDNYSNNENTTNIDTNSDSSNSTNNSSSMTSSNLEKDTNINSTDDEQKQYIGVPDPNNPNYSFHLGKIDYSTRDKCLEDYEIIGFKDTVDIINGWCIEVYDSNNIILGYYLYLNCQSGNCNKYKN